MPGSGNEQTDPANVAGKRCCGYWTRSIPIPRVCFIIMMLCVVIWSLSTVLKDVPLRDRDRVSVSIKGGVDRDSPDTQLVGHCTHVWWEKGVQCETTMTVIYEGREYRGVWGAPEDFLRSLLDPERYPKLAGGPRERIPLRATTDREAIEEASRLFRDPD